MSGEIGHNGGPPLDWGSYGGFIVESRASRSHPVVGYGQPVKPADDTRGSYSRNEAWRDLCHECRYQDGYVVNGGRKMLLQRGSLLGAVSWLAQRWNWTPKTVRVFLDKLEDDGMITCVSPGTMTGSTYNSSVSDSGKQKGKQASVITICNYDKFNPIQAGEGQAKGQEEGKQGASKGQARGNIYKEEQGNKETRKQEEKEIPLQPEETAAPRGGGGYDPEFVELNGTASHLIGFISRAAHVDEKTARHMLKTNIEIFGRDAMMEAFVASQAEMATGLVANPYKYMIGVAKRAKANKARPDAPVESRSDRWARKMAKLEEASK